MSLLQTALFVIAIGGNFIPAINQHPLYQQLQEKRLFIFLGGYFGLNMLQNAISSTGAFEVYLNDALIFSKLTSNRLPSPEEILAHL